MSTDVNGFSKASLKHLKSTFNSQSNRTLPRYVQKKRVRIRSDPAKEEVASQVKILEMLEFPLPKRLWQDDKDVKRCSVCNCRFSKYFKGGKHHCRICGKVVCSNCSQNKLRGYRICRKCQYDKEVLQRFPELLLNKALWLKSPTGSFKTEVQISDPEDGSGADAPKDESECTNSTEQKVEKVADQRSDQGPLSSCGGTDIGNKSRTNMIETSVNLGRWKTAHCVRWIMSLGLGKNEETIVKAMKDVGLCGSDLQAISDNELLSELKIYSTIHRRRVLSKLQDLTQEEVDEILKIEEMRNMQPLSNKDLAGLARDVKVLKEGRFAAIDRIKMLNSPEYKYQVEWYATNIPRGIHTVTVIDLNEVVNSSHWVVKYDGSTLATHCLTKNFNTLRWRLHNSSIEVSVANTTDQLNTDLVFSLQTVTLPERVTKHSKTSSSS